MKQKQQMERKLTCKNLNASIENNDPEISEN